MGFPLPLSRPAQRIPRRGSGGVPLFLKHRRAGGGTTAQAKPNPPLNEGASYNKPTRLGEASATAPLQNQNKYAIVPPGSGQPVHSASSKPAVDGSTGGLQYSPMAEALREHHRRRQWRRQAGPGARRPGGMFPQPRNPPRKAETGAIAVARRAPCSHPAQLWMRYDYAMTALWLRYDCAMAPCLKPPKSG